MSLISYKNATIAKNNISDYSITKSWTPGYEINEEGYYNLYYDVVSMRPDSDRYLGAILNTLADTTTDNIIKVDNKLYYVYIMKYDKKTNILNICKSKIDTVNIGDHVNMYEKNRRRIQITFKKGFNAEEFLNLEKKRLAVTNILA
jgi:hypothetical protein